MDIQVEDAHVLTPNKRVIFISAGPNEGVLFHRKYLVMVNRFL